MVDGRHHHTGPLEDRLGFAQFIEAVADLEGHVMQADRRGGVAATLPADLQDREVMMIAETEEGHLHPVLVEPGHDRQAEQAVVEALGARPIGHAQDHVAQGFDLHRFVSPQPC
jgi:hypothetical protein